MINQRVATLQATTLKTLYPEPKILNPKSLSSLPSVFKIVYDIYDYFDWTAKANTSFSLYGANEFYIIA